MNKIKVLHIIPDLGIGGAEKLVLDICKFSNKEKFDVKVISLFECSGSIYDQFALDNNIEVYYLNKNLGFDYKIIKKLKCIFKNENVDIIHTHLYVMPYVILAAIQSRKFNIIHTVHNEAKRELRDSIKKVMNIAYKLFNVTPVGISNYITKTIIKEYNLNNRFIPCIYNGIDTNRFKNSINTSYNYPKNDIVQLVNIGRFTKQKNHKLLIDSFYKALKSNKNLTLKLVGDGPLKSDMETYVKELGISKNVIFRGIQQDICSELNDSDIFIMSSDWEGLPISILEAMSCSLPIISTNAGGISDIVNHNENGIIVEVGDRDGLYNAILKLTSDHELIIKMGENSLKLSSQYDICNQVKKYESLYEEKNMKKI